MYTEVPQVRAREVRRHELIAEADRQRLAAQAQDARRPPRVWLRLVAAPRLRLLSARWGALARTVPVVGRAWRTARW